MQPSKEDISMKSQSQISTITHKTQTNHVARIAFTGNENHVITLDKATYLTEAYRNSVPQGSLLGGAFSRDILDRLLRQQKCVGLRIYNASNDDGSPTFLLVGVNSNNNDLFSRILAAQPAMRLTSLAERLTETNPAHTDDRHDDTDIGVSFISPEGALTSLAEASRLTRNFRESIHGTFTKGGFFGRNIFHKILSQPGCVGIHIYFARRDDGRLTFVLAGIDASGRHYAKWPFGDDTYLCPPFCSPSNVLNG
jgi:hypothetical protein